MARSQYKNRFIFPSGEFNQINHQWKPMVSISWKTTTQKFHSISDLVGAFETEREAVAFAAQAAKAWVDTQPPVPPERRETAVNDINKSRRRAIRIENTKIVNSIKAS